MAEKNKNEVLNSAETSQEEKTPDENSTAPVVVDFTNTGGGETPGEQPGQTEPPQTEQPQADTPPMDNPAPGIVDTLVFIHSDVHELIHATKSETIQHYIGQICPNSKQLAEINKLRIKVGNKAIS